MRRTIAALSLSLLALPGAMAQPATPPSR